MPKLIDDDKFNAYLQKNSVNHTLADIDAQPTVDAVEVVRCKDCKWGTPHPEGDEYTKCFKLCTTFFSGHYCAWGERREDDVVSGTNGTNL